MNLISEKNGFSGLLTFLLQSVCSYLHFTWRGELLKLTEVAKIAKKTACVGSCSFEVIECVTSGKGMCDFLSVSRPYLARLGTTATYWSKVASGTYSCHI